MDRNWLKKENPIILNRRNIVKKCFTNSTSNGGRADILKDYYVCANCGKTALFYLISSSKRCTKSIINA